jgi:hypothetical protein
MTAKAGAQDVARLALALMEQVVTRNEGDQKWMEDVEEGDLARCLPGGYIWCGAVCQGVVAATSIVNAPQADSCS